jgi:hypothetical protein
MPTRTARRILLAYLGFIIYMDLAHFLASGGVASLPLSITDLPLYGEVSIATHAGALVLIVFLFVILGQQEANPVGAGVPTSTGAG